MEAHEKRIKLIDHAMYVWRNHSEEYRTKIDTYRILLAKKRELKITPLHVVKESIVREYPYNKFLSQTDEEKARQILEVLDEQKIQKLLDDIYDMWHSDYAFVTLSARIADYEYQIKHYGEEKFAFGYDPRYVNGSSLGSHRTTHHYQE